MYDETAEHSCSATLSSRERILRAAKHLFADQGYEGTSTMSIARAIGTSETQILRKFGSKEGLLEAILDADWELIRHKLLQADNTSSSPMQRLKMLLTQVVCHMDKDHELKKLMAAEFGRIRPKQGHDILVTRGYLRSAAILDELFEEMQRTGRLRPDMPPHTARSALFGIMANMWRDQLQAPYDSAYGSEQILTATELFLSSISPLARAHKAGPM